MGMEIEGDQALSKLFRNFGPKDARKAVRQAAREAAKAIAFDAKIKVPRETGTLKRSIKVRAMKRTRRGRIGSRVITGKGFFKGETYYGGFVEYGTAKMQAKPFLRPAMDENKTKTHRMFINHMRESIKRLEREGKRRG